MGAGEESLVRIHVRRYKRRLKLRATDATPFVLACAAAVGKISGIVGLVAHWLFASFKQQAFSNNPPRGLFSRAEG